MALSNIFVEPRRELTESGIGIAFVGLLLLIDLPIAFWIEHRIDRLPFGAAMVIGFLSIVIIFLALLLIHLIGEGLCNYLTRQGIEIRPKIRYRMDRAGRRYEC
jgi:hypothetical protein